MVAVKKLVRKEVNPFKTYLSLVLFLAPALFAQPRYNLIKDSSFEQPKPKTTWKEYVWLESHGNKADNHYNNYGKGGYESDYCGLTQSFDLSNQIPALAWAKLIQGLEHGFSPRTITEIDSAGWYFYFYPYSPDGIATFGVMVTSEQGDTLVYQYGNYDEVKKDTTHYKIIKLDFFGKDSIWNYEARLLGGVGGDWITKGFPSNALIEEVVFYSKGYNAVTIGSPYGAEAVEWDSVQMWSVRFDHDASTVLVNSIGYTPDAEVKNVGTFSESFAVICNIFQSGNRVYSDSVNVDSLAVDSIKQVNFKPYSDTGNMIIYTALPGDQNPGNDTLSKNLGVQEAVIKKPIEFKVWPTLTKGVINISSPNPIRIYNIYGRAVASGEPGVSKFTLNPAGVYFVKSGGEIRKIVKIE